MRGRVVNKNIFFSNSRKINVRKGHILTIAGSKTSCYLLEFKYYKYVYEYGKRKKSNKQYPSPTPYYRFTYYKLKKNVLKKNTSDYNKTDF